MRLTSKPYRLFSQPQSFVGAKGLATSQPTFGRENGSKLKEKPSYKWL